MALRRVLRAVLVTAIAGTAGLLLTTPAAAAPTAPVTAPATHPDSSLDDIEWGRTTLQLDAGTAAVLADNGVSVSPTGDAHPTGSGIAFPITGGALDLGTLAGTIEHSGGLEFRAGDTVLGVQDFVIDTAAGVLTAEVSGTDTRVPLLDLDLSGAAVEADSKGVTVRGVQAALTAEAAAALNETFGVSLFTEGIPVGTAKVVACV
jgi:hypothetical protein